MESPNIKTRRVCAFILIFLFINSDNLIKTVIKVHNGYTTCAKAYHLKSARQNKYTDCTFYELTFPTVYIGGCFFFVFFNGKI